MYIFILSLGVSGTIHISLLALLVIKFMFVFCIFLSCHFLFSFFFLFSVVLYAHEFSIIFVA